MKDIWRLSKQDRWRLYRRWLHTKTEGYKRTITRYQEQFEEGARRLKDIKDMEDMIILKEASVIGMTTTGLVMLCS